MASSCRPRSLPVLTTRMMEGGAHTLPDPVSRPMAWKTAEPTPLVEKILYAALGVLILAVIGNLAA